MSDSLIKLIAFIFFGVPLLLVLGWALLLFLFVAVLGRPDLCPMNLC